MQDYKRDLMRAEFAKAGAEGARLKDFETPTAKHIDYLVQVPYAYQIHQAVVCGANEHSFPTLYAAGDDEAKRLFKEAFVELNYQIEFSEFVRDGDPPGLKITVRW